MQPEISRKNNTKKSKEKALVSKKLQKNQRKNVQKEKKTRKRISMDEVEEQK